MPGSQETLTLTIPRELVKAAKIAATERDTTVSAVVRRFLELWIRNPSILDEGQQPQARPKKRG